MTWHEEADTITQAAVRTGVDPYFVMAIRRAEHGRPGREFGVLSVPAPTYADQLAVTLNTLIHQLTHYNGQPFTYIRTPSVTLRLIYSPAFVTAFANGWAPRGAANDPANLNYNWANNVEAIYHDLAQRGPLDQKFTATWS